MKQSEFAKLLGGCTGIVLFLAFIIYLQVDSPENQIKYTKDKAYQNSRRVLKIKYNLHPPPIFQILKKDGNLNDTTFLIISYVDSQNAYGAMIRADYKCYVTYFPSTREIECSEIVIESR